MLEEQKMEMQQMEAEEVAAVIAYRNIPYFMLDNEVTSTKRGEIQNEFHEIIKFYRIYKKGSAFLPEGTNGHYIPSKLRYKKAALILNKEARFMFANPPTFSINREDVDTKYKNENAILQGFLDKVLQRTNFSGKLIKAVKDCFIGKRIAIVLNVSEDNGITVTFLNSLEFIYETSGQGNDDNELTKFVTFYQMNDTDSFEEQKWFKKKYTKERDGIYLQEQIYSGTGKFIENVTAKTRIKFDYIPAVVVLNNGLTGDYRGVSELADLMDSESYYSKLANADIDAERKSMNPIKYTIDASEGSTKNLSTSPGSYWDIQSDDEKSIERSAKVGTLEAQMNYSNPLKTTLNRLENDMYSSVDVPNMTNEQLAGIITSGKTIRALYWGLTVRCDEKMVASWQYALTFVAKAVIDSGKLYPECIGRYLNDTSSIPDIPFTILVENHYPLPDDVNEAKTMDIAEVESKVMSRKSYLKKWRKLNDNEADAELRQIKYENELLDDSYLATMYSSNSEDNEDQGLSISYEDPEKNAAPQGNDKRNI